MIVSNMWIFGRHKHLKPELLSEYLDGRLDSSTHAKVSRQLGSCEACREELGSFQSTVSLLRALPEFATPRSFMLASSPVLRPIILHQPLPLRALGWAYAGAASVAGLALAIMVSANTMGTLAPSRPPAISIQSSEIAAQSLPDSDAPQAGLSSARATSQPQIAAAEPRARAQPEIAAAPGSDSVLALRAAESPQQSAEAASAMAPDHELAAPGTSPGTSLGTASEARAIADAASANGLTATTAPQDTKVDATVLSENPDNQPAELADEVIVGVAKAEPEPLAAPTLDRYQGTPNSWAGA